MGILRYTAGLESGHVRRGLQIALGLVWLLDAALQYQPYMFSRGFVTQVLESAADGNPAVVLTPAMWADRLISHDVAAWNAAFATIQLAIAVGLLWRPTVRAALAGSIAWSLAVWWLSEGMGDVLTGTPARAGRRVWLTRKGSIYRHCCDDSLNPRSLPASEWWISPATLTPCRAR